MANTIKIGSDSAIYKVGSTDVDAIYLGTILVYSGGTPPTPTFQGKWIATYTGGTTSSAECDASSAITSGEITLTDLTEVEIGDCVTSIGNRVFQECTGLTSIYIPSGVTSIGDYAFNRCRSLTSIDIPNSVTSIGFYTFRNCYSLTSIDIPNSVTSIGDYAFQECTGLTSINIPSGVTSIGDYAFNRCTSLSSCTIGSGVTSIGNQAFSICRGLTSITINAVTPPTLGDNTFSNTNDCPIYVPSASVDTYKSASGWSTYASRIQAIQNS